MGLVWVGEDEVETVITAFEATAAFVLDDEEAVVAGLFGALVEALFQAQESANARVRWAELLVDANGDRCAPVVSQAIMRLATESHIMRNELGKVANGPTAQESEDAYEGDVYDITNLAPAH
jgi:hypothetical protein